MENKANFKEIVAITIAVYQILLPRIIVMIAAIILCSIGFKYLF